MVRRIVAVGVAIIAGSSASPVRAMQVLDGDLSDLVHCRIRDTTPDVQGRIGVEDDPLGILCSPAGEGNNPSGMNVAAIRAHFNPFLSNGTYYFGIELAPGRIPFDVDFNNDTRVVDASVAGRPGCSVPDVGQESYTFEVDVGDDGVLDLLFELRSLNGILPPFPTVIVSGGHPSSDFEFSLGPLVAGNPTGQPEISIRNVFLTLDPGGRAIPIRDFFLVGLRVVASATRDSSDDDIAQGTCIFPEGGMPFVDGDLRDLTDCRIPDTSPDNQGQIGIQDDPLSLRCSPAGEGNNPSGMNVGAIRAALDPRGTGTYFFGIELAPGRIPFDVDFNNDVAIVDGTVSGQPDCFVSDTGPESYSLEIDVGDDGSTDIAIELRSENGLLPASVGVLESGGHPQDDFLFSLGPVVRGNPRGQPEIAVRNVFATVRSDGSAIPPRDFFRARVRAIATAVLDSSEEDIAQGVCTFPDGAAEFLLCREGTVNARAGAVSDVLFVNGFAGSGRERVVILRTGDPLAIEMRLPPSVPAGGLAPFALYVWESEPAPESIRVLPHGMGTSCLPMPLSGGSPRLVWNNTGRARLGVPQRPSLPAPSTVLSVPRVGVRARVFLQGLVADPLSAGRRRASVTNGLVVDVR